MFAISVVDDARSRPRAPLAAFSRSRRHRVVGVHRANCFLLNAPHQASLAFCAQHNISRRGTSGRLASSAGDIRAHFRACSNVLTRAHRDMRDTRLIASRGRHRLRRLAITLCAALIIVLPPRCGKTYVFAGTRHRQTANALVKFARRFGVFGDFRSFGMFAVVRPVCATGIVCWAFSATRNKTMISRATGVTRYRTPRHFLSMP